MTEAGDRIRLLFDWASAQDARRRLLLWLLVAAALHGAAYLLVRVAYPPAAPLRISDASLYVLLPGSAEARRIAPFLAAADPALFAPENAHGLRLPDPPAPAYEPSYAVTRPQLVALPDAQPRVLPPLVRDFGPVPVRDKPARPGLPPAPATRTQIVFSQSLAVRAPGEWPPAGFTARPGDRLAPTTFLVAVAPDGRVLHVFKDSTASGDDNKSLDDAASQYLMGLRFRGDRGARELWGTATFHWGLDVKREEIR